MSKVLALMLLLAYNSKAIAAEPTVCFDSVPKEASETSPELYKTKYGVLSTDGGDVRVGSGVYLNEPYALALNGEINALTAANQSLRASVKEMAGKTAQAEVDLQLSKAKELDPVLVSLLLGAIVLGAGTVGFGIAKFTGK